MRHRGSRIFKALDTITGVIALALVASSPFSAAKLIIKIGSPTIKESVHHWMMKFEKRIEKRSGDRIDAKVFPLGQLGTIEIAMIPPAFLVGLDQRYQVVSAPGVFKDLFHGFRKVQDPEFKKAF